jgi:hypothetical protein
MRRESAVSFASSFGSFKWIRSGSMICLPIFTTGFSDVIGSWNTMAMCVLQSSRSSSFGAFRISWVS